MILPAGSAATLSCRASPTEIRHTKRLPDWSVFSYGRGFQKAHGIRCRRPLGCGGGSYASVDGTLDFSAALRGAHSCCASYGLNALATGETQVAPQSGAVPCGGIDCHFPGPGHLGAWCCARSAAQRSPSRFTERGAPGLDAPGDPKLGSLAALPLC